MKIVKFLIFAISLVPLFGCGTDDTFIFAYLDNAEFVNATTLNINENIQNSSGSFSLEARINGKQYPTSLLSITGGTLKLTAEAPASALLKPAKDFCDNTKSSANIGFLELVITSGDYLLVETVSSGYSDAFVYYVYADNDISLECIMDEDYYPRTNLELKKGWNKFTYSYETTGLKPTNTTWLLLDDSDDEWYDDIF